MAGAVGGVCSWPLRWVDLHPAPASGRPAERVESGRGRAPVALPGERLAGGPHSLGREQ